MHRHTQVWRAVGLAVALLLCALPAQAAKRHRSQRTKSVPKIKQVSSHTRRARASAGPRTYTVRRGDTLEAIAKRLGTTPKAIAQTNRLRSMHRLALGQVLRVPGASAPRPARVTTASRRSAPAGSYTVRRGDNLIDIAKRLGTTPKALASANGLRSVHRIAEGQVLRVPGTPAARPVRIALATNPTDATCDSDSLVQTAMKYRGVPYRYAGMTARGLDCSGLVARVLQTHGIRAPHHAASLYKLGVAVSREDLRSGDLVFFNTRGNGISHVGIYTGKGQFVHASSGGGRVMVSKLTEGYYQRRYVGARRLTAK